MTDPSPAGRYVEDGGLNDVVEDELKFDVVDNLEFKLEADFLDLDGFILGLVLGKKSPNVFSLIPSSPELSLCMNVET